MTLSFCFLKKILQSSFIMVLLCCTINLFGQLAIAKETYKVVPAKFSPPIKDMINSFLEKPAPAFQANDLLQHSISPSTYYGKSLVLFFWNTTESINKDYIPYLNALSNEINNLRADIVSFGDESRSMLTDFVEKNNIKYTVIPNGSFLGEAIYGKELGTPRFFLLDKKGIVKHIITQEQAVDPKKTIDEIREYLKELMSNN